MKTVKELYPNADGLIGGEMENMTLQEVLGFISLDNGLGKIKKYVFDSWYKGEITEEQKARFYETISNVREIYKSRENQNVNKMLNDTRKTIMELIHAA